MTACQRLLKYELLNDPNVVKVVRDNENNAIYFSRSCIPHIRDNHKFLNDKKKFLENTIFYKHVGIYGYKKDFLMTYSRLENSNLEKIEMLEQLRILENGFKIRVLETKFNSIGIDTRDDYDKALKMIEKGIFE